MRRKIKVNFVDFWGAFNKTDNLIWNLMSRKYDMEISEDPDILFYSYLGQEFKKYSCTRVMFIGENFRPNFKECDFAFSFDIQPDNPRNYRLPLYVLYDDVNKLLKPKDPEEIAKSKPGFCAFVVSNKYSLERLDFFKKLSKYRKVDSGGKVLNNVGGPVPNKIDFIKDYKFTIAFENSSYPGYTTEKIFEPMLVNSIPIYWGNPKVELDFNPKSFINSHDYSSEEEVIEKIIEIDRNQDLYYEMLSQPYFKNNQLNEFVREENIMKQLDDIVDSLGTSTPVGINFKPESGIARFIKVKIRYAILKLKHLVYRIKSTVSN